MTEQGRKKSTILAGFYLRAACFAVLLLALLSYVCYVLTPKHDYGICSMLNLYRQPENSVDVLAVGTSIAYAGINTNVLWQEYGIASYNLCSAEQPFWISYYMLREALKTQRPKVILLDAKPAIYPDDYTPRGRIILSTFGILSAENRLGAMRACVKEPKDAWPYILAFPQIHSNYSALSWNDFVIPPDNGGRGKSWKGYIEEDMVEHHTRPTLVWSKVCRSMNAREEAYARKIFELARAEGIPLLLVGMPNPDYASDHLYFNSLWSIAQEYGIEGLNYNEPSLRYGLRYSSDFADWQHLNVKGSMTFSRRLGEDLVARYGLSDHRGDAAYASYDECARAWYEKCESFESFGTKGAETP